MKSFQSGCDFAGTKKIIHEFEMKMEISFNALPGFNRWTPNFRGCDRFSLPVETEIIGKSQYYEKQNNGKRPLNIQRIVLFPPVILVILERGSEV